ncbi:hypothetical protein [Labrenzia sp. DG1229]|uniref:hypothetical protein n=1 Tax=Labrenzia sp. DG1229 TaxID=681847 RepID=UPI00048BE0BB|nr:hypothetical protein [Labrenzia sp. DG1229]
MRSTYLAMLVFFLFGYSDLHVHAEVKAPETDPIETQQIEAKEIGRARQAFSGFGLDQEEKQEIHRALRELGYANEDLEIPDFLLRKSTIQAVAEFQRTIGAAATGFLTSDQVEVLRDVAGRSSQNAHTAGNNAKLAFENLNLGCEDHRVLYRALYALGHTARRTAFPDFLTDEAVVAAVTEFQEENGANATGYLTKDQVDNLQADAGKPYLWEQRACGPDQLLFPLNEWSAAGYSESDKQAVFDILHAHGLLTGDRLSNSLSNRNNKDAVRRFQTSVGAEQTGYLTNRQADGILNGWLLPTPRQTWVALAVPDAKKKFLFRALVDLGYLWHTAPLVDFTFNEDLIRAVRRYQYASNFPTTGFLTGPQIELLLAHEIKPVPAATRQAKKRWSNPVMSWRYDDYSEGELTLIYKALNKKGFFLDEAVNTDLTHPELVERIRKYQESIAAKNPTGYLTHRQIAGLMAGLGNRPPQDQLKKKSAGLLGKKTPQVQPSARSAWEKLGYSLDKQQKIYRALYHLGLAKSPEMITDFSYRMNLIEVVRTYQEQNGYEVTGFLTSKQAVKLWSVKAPMLPSEQQVEFFGGPGRSAILGFFRELGVQEFGIGNPISTIAKRLQDRFKLTAHGYITPELFEKAKAIPLQVIRETPRPQTLYFGAVELPSAKDWGLWKSKDAAVCETSTFSIHEDGFTGSAMPAGVALKRVAGWKRNSVNISVRLRNWKRDTIAQLRVRGRTYLMMEAFGRTVLVGEDGLRMDNYNKNYSSLIDGMMSANGFEITYETDFGTKVVVSFSALGLTKQLRAIMNVC